jgi:hypothetical protein
MGNEGQLHEQVDQKERSNEGKHTWSWGNFCCNFRLMEGKNSEKKHLISKTIDDHWFRHY